MQGFCNYEMTNAEIQELNGDSDTCDLWRNLCPSAACGNSTTDYVYSPYFEECISTTYENPSTTTIGHAYGTTSSSTSMNIIDTTTTIMSEAPTRTAANTNFNSDSNPDSNSSNGDNEDDDIDVSFIVIYVCITLIVCCGMTLIFVYKCFTYKLKLVSKPDHNKQNKQEMAPIGSHDKNDNKNSTNGDDIIQHQNQEYNLNEFYGEYGAIGCIIHCLDGYHFYFYQLLQLFIFMAIYGAMFAVTFKWARILSTSEYFLQFQDHKHYHKDNYNKDNQNRRKNSSNSRSDQASDKKDHTVEAVAKLSVEIKIPSEVTKFASTICKIDMNVCH